MEKLLQIKEIKNKLEIYIANKEERSEEVTEKLLGLLSEMIELWEEQMIKEEQETSLEREIKKEREKLLSELWEVLKNKKNGQE